MDFNRYDVSTKELVWDDPVAWLRRLGIEPTGPVDVIESEVTTLTASADKVIRVADPDAPFLVNIELQAGHDSQLMRTLWFRQVALDYRHDLPVLTVLVLLRKQANSPSLTGLYERFLPDGQPTNRYHYRVVKLWKEPAASFLDAEVELVPLAPLANVKERQLPALVRRMAERINALPSDRAAKLWAASYILMGLRYPDEVIEKHLGGVQAVKESTTYQKILRDGRALGLVEGHAEGLVEGLVEGRADGVRRTMIRQGTKRFGEPDAAALAAIEGIHDIDRLEDLADRLLDAGLTGWDALLGQP